MLPEDWGRGIIWRRAGQDGGDDFPRCGIWMRRGAGAGDAEAWYTRGAALAGAGRGRERWGICGGRWAAGDVAGQRCAADEHV